MLAPGDRGARSSSVLLRNAIVASLGAGDGRGLPCPGYTASADRGNQNHILNDYTFWFESGHGSVTERFKPIATFMELLSTKVRRFDYR
jgi:hypothetical protein